MNEFPEGHVKVPSWELFILHIVSLRNSLELIYLTEEKMYGSISNKAVF